MDTYDPKGAHARLLKLRVNGGHAIDYFLLRIVLRGLERMKWALTSIDRIHAALFEDKSVAWHDDEISDGIQHGSASPLTLRTAHEKLAGREMRQLHALTYLLAKMGHLVDYFHQHLTIVGREGELAATITQLDDALGRLRVAFRSVDFADAIGATAPPARYSHEGQREAIDLIRDLLGDEGFIGFCVGQVVKYRYREGTKGADDRAKALWYAHMALHVQSGGLEPDPRAHRPTYVRYVAQPYTHGVYGLSPRDPDTGLLGVLMDMAEGDAR